MAANRIVEQHIAFFGESGSGKTVLASSFYGAGQNLPEDAPFRIHADDMGHHVELYQNYLGMRDSARAPELTKFKSHSYAFSVSPKRSPEAGHNRGAPFEALQLVWHDYPGEWFQQEPSGPTEAQRRVDTFRSLLSSDIAFFLVDAQLLIDNAGGEERYLKSVFSNFSTGLFTLRNEILSEGKKLEEFPRIWVIALSKADLLPEMDVSRFRDLVIEKAGSEVIQLRDTLSEFVEDSEALALGEDFMLLSGAKFEVDTIDVKENIGADLILPLAAILPLERHARWHQAGLLRLRAVERLLSIGTLGAGAVAAALLGIRLRFGRLALLQGLIATVMSPERIEEAANLAGEKLRARHAEALEQHNYLTATLTGFKIALEQAEDDRILHRSTQWH